MDNDIDVSMSGFTSKESRLKYRKFQPVQKRCSFNVCYLLFKCLYILWEQPFMATNGSMNCTFSRIFPRIVEQSIGSAADHLLLQQQHMLCS